MPTLQRRPSYRSVRVIGVTEDVTSSLLTDGLDETCVYFPTGFGAEGELALLVRGRVDNASVKAAVMAAVEAVDPDAPFQFYSLREMLGAQVWIVRMISTVASVLGALGLAFAFSGTYAVVAFLVTARTREFGIRLALGGTVPQIVRGILGEMLRITSVGLAGGLILAFGLVRFISGATPMILPFGAPPYLIGALVVVLAAATAALLPSLRAGRIDPSAALRAE
jgi:ABC-type lipoprotein release transport system permease subunit